VKSSFTEYRTSVKSFDRVSKARSLREGLAVGSDGFRFARDAAALTLEGAQGLQPMFWFCFWMMALWNSERRANEATDWLTPPGWSGNFWGSAARQARLAGEHPPLPMNPAMLRWNRWGRNVLREGDIVFRLGDARGGKGVFALSWFIARATASPFSHTGIVAVEQGSPVVYDCSDEGARCMPFEVWMLECVGPMGVKRLKPAHRDRIPGVIDYCRRIFEQDVPFDFGFRLDDSSFYCLELTEKAFRSQGLALSQPVRIGDWERLTSFPLSAILMAPVTRVALGCPITLDQPVYLPGNQHQGTWASPLLETVFGPEPKWDDRAAPRLPDGFNLRGDMELIVLAAAELRRSYSELPVQWMHELALHPRIQGLIFGRGPDAHASCLLASPSGFR
jgi:hypothetical protein